MAERPRIERTARREDAFMTPKPVPGEPGRFVVDATWGTLNPIELASGVATVGELEVREHAQAGLPLIDTRPARVFAKATIPGARNIPHRAIAERVGDVDPDNPTVLFCNGPQCSATPKAIRALLDAGRPPSGILYYRGGIHDWVTLGMPVTPGKDQ
jgi:rhodanese-related sulfurtransferase